MILQARFLEEMHGLNKVQGKPFAVGEIISKIQEMAG